MPAYPVLADEAQRLAALYELTILDSAPESDYDAIARLVSAICETPVALVSLVDADRQWFKARVGFEPCETSREVSFCAHAIARPDEIFVVSEARSDPRFADNELVTGPPFVRFYAGVPLVTSSGRAIGTICVLDTVPRDGLTPEQREALTLVARVAVILMERRQAIDELNAIRRSHERANARLQFLASHDALTSLPNRAHFVDVVRAEAATSHDFAIAFLDLDRFKVINDTLGHAAGDALLIEVARRVRQMIRPEDLLARLGGDEFVICFRNVRTDEAARAAAMRVTAALSLPYPLGETQRCVLGSVGVTRARPGSTVETLLREADEAMYAAKRRGRGAVVVSGSEDEMAVAAS